ncbi:integral peroxisomal membrane peroxin-domain-containing protein [Phycomyces blakesleeanus]|uniref:Integral peroxisomal membrane peroxin-domain-containing protein n=1 Tax=Phycomyces blakesleeanus TaxID=4837 RepID=A0ABR3BC57_PHYBL
MSPTSDKVPHEEGIPNFSSPYSVDTIDQIPTPLLSALVSLGPLVQITATLVKVITWQTSHSLSVLAILAWIVTCIWTRTVLQCLPVLLLVKLASDWFRIRTRQARRLTLDRKKKSRLLRRVKSKKTQSSEEEDSPEQPQEEDEEVLKRKVLDDEISLDDTLQNIITIQAWVVEIQHSLKNVLIYLDGTQSECIVTVLSVLLYAWPVWAFFLWWLGVSVFVGFVGALLIAYPSPMFQVAIQSLKDNRMLYHAAVSLYAYSVALVVSCRLLRPVFKPNKGIIARLSDWVKQLIGRANNEKQKAFGQMAPVDAEIVEKPSSKSEMVFQFEVFENQRWWLGMGWTTNMMPSERTAWTDNQLMPILSKEKFDLPEPTEANPTMRVITSKSWSWADSEWWVDMTKELDGKIDRNGWAYGNNAWHLFTSSPGLGTYTRRRRWCRRARLIERINEKAEQYRPKGSAKVTSIEKRYPYLHYTTPHKTLNDKQEKKKLAKVKQIANWLDNAVPGSPVPLGIDSLLSFIPFIGGFLGSILAMYQNFMIGIIPIIGGFLDMFYKANLWNAEALEDWLAHPGPILDPVTGSSAAVATQITWRQLTHDALHIFHSMVPFISPANKS